MNSMEGLPLQEKEPNVLSYEDFTKKDERSHPIYNNFVLPFMNDGGLVVEMYRSLPHFTRFIQENPDLYKSICTQMKTLYVGETNKMSKIVPLEPELYKAYKIMKEYAGMTDAELFK